MALLSGISILIVLFCAIGAVALVVIIGIAIGSAVKKKNERKRLEREIMAENAAMHKAQDPENPYLQKFNEVQ